MTEAPGGDRVAGGHRHAWRPERDDGLGADARRTRIGVGGVHGVHGDPEPGGQVGDPLVEPLRVPVHPDHQATPGIGRAAGPELPRRDRHVESLSLEGDQQPRGRVPVVPEDVGGPGRTAADAAVDPLPKRGR